MPTAKTPQFIKVINQAVAGYLITAGFSYCKEGDTFVFRANPEIIAVLQRQFSTDQYVIESKLRF